MDALASLAFVFEERRSGIKQISLGVRRSKSAL